MTTSRLLTYAVSGIIAGLLIENMTIRAKYSATDNAHKLKARLDKKMEKTGKQVNGLLHRA